MNAEHAQDWWRRLRWPVLAVCVGAGAGYLMRGQVVSWLQAPLQGNLYFSDVSGGFELQACLLAGLLAAIPVAVYELAGHLGPKLPAPPPRRQLNRLAATSAGLTVAAVAFAYYLALPAVLRLMSATPASPLRPLIAADSYLNFVMAYIAVFAVMLQLPLLALFFDRLRPLPLPRFKHWRQWVILGTFGAALILPVAPDPLSQIMLALPVVVVYELTIWLLVLSRYRRRPPAQPAPPPAPPVQTRLPMAIALPNRTPRVPRKPANMEPVARTRPQTIDLREH